MITNGRGNEITMIDLFVPYTMLYKEHIIGGPVP